MVEPLGSGTSRYKGQECIATMIGHSLADQPLGLIHFPLCVGLCFQFLKANTKMCWGDKQSQQAFCTHHGYRQTLELKEIKVAFQKNRQEEWKLANTRYLLRTSSGLLSPLIRTLLRGPEYYSHLSGREAEAQKGKVTYSCLYC